MKRYLVWIIVFIVTLYPISLHAAALEFKAPAGLKLPIEAKAVTGDRSAWQKEGDLWVLAQDRWGIVDTPAWWKGNRPPRTEMVVLEIEYQDNLKMPVRAEIYSGLGTDNPWSELHRFGGTNDGAWKKARIPASADFIFRREPEAAIRFRLISDEGTLRVKSFSLAAPLPDEETRYNRETREWVARVQERGQVDSSYYHLAQAPVLSGIWETKPLVPFNRNWMDLVLPISAPQAGEAGSPLAARMFLNEFESAQLGIFANGRELRHVEVTVDPIKDKTGSEVAKIMVRVAEYSKVKGTLIPSFFIEPFPQRLWPAYPFDVPAGRSHLVWLVLRTTEKISKPGKYTTQVRIKAQGVDEVTVPLNLEILDMRLLTMEEAGLRLGGCTMHFIPEFEMAFLKDYNHNMINIWYQSERPELTRKGDTFELNWRVFDEWMGAAKRAGMTDIVYFLGGNPYGFPRTMHLPRIMAQVMLGLDDKGWSELAFRNPYEVPSEVAPYMAEWARRFGEHARANNWPNVILTPFDEPAKWHQYSSGLGMLYYIKPQFKKQVALIRQGDPKAQIYGSIHHYYGGIEFLEDVDIFCTNAVAENFNLPDEVRKGGKILWQYSGTTDKSMPAVARYTFGFYFAGHGSIGSLVWAYNWGNRFDTIDGDNWMYVVNTPFDLIPMPYMEGLREAWDERRIIETLRHRAAEKNVDISDFLSNLFAEVARGRGRGGTSTLDDFWEKAKNDLILDEWHNRLVEKLLSLK
jgi:hypothetical protein